MKKDLRDIRKDVNNNIERRFLIGQEDTEVRIVREKDQPVKIVGYFAKFNKMSQQLGWFREIIEPDFFRQAIKKSDTVDLFNHDANYVMGRVSSGTLRVWEDKIGLAFECHPPDTQIIRDLVLTPIERGDIKGCSFGFTIRSRWNDDEEDGDTWFEDQDGSILRTLKADGCKELFDGSQVTFPAYLDTDCALRSMNAWKDQMRIEIEKIQKQKDEIELKNRQYIEMKRRKLAFRNNI